MTERIKKLWKSLGPGLITGASGNDPAGITAYSIAGARYGYVMLWVLLFILPFMIAIQEMSARIGAISGCGLAGNIKRHYPGWLLAIIASMIVLANTFNVGANIYGMAGALNLLIPLNVQFLAVILSGIVLVMTIFLRYSQIVTIFKWLSLTLFAYVAAFFLIQDIQWGAILRYTLIPFVHFDRDFLVVLFAVVGTTISPYLYFWQASEEAEEFRQGHPRVKVCKYHAIHRSELNRMESDTKIGMLFSNVISFFVVALAAATVFHAGTGNIETLREAAEALRPLAGDYAYFLFTLGILGVGLLAIPVLAGSAAYVIAEVFNWRGSLDERFSRAKQFYFAIVVSVIIGLSIPFLGITPVQALFYTGVLNGLISPILILMVIHMANNKDIVGPHVSRPIVVHLGHASFFVMLAGTIFVFMG
jgi:NRAMP (natural resistance-associated macrophage protein)-like metal ion transporter